MNSITLRELATKLNMGKSTVQRALAGSPKVDPKTRLRVEKASQKWGYQRDAYFATLSAHRHRTNKPGLTVHCLLETAGEEPQTHKGLHEYPALATYAPEFGLEVEFIKVRNFKKIETLPRILYHQGSAGLLLGNCCDELKKGLLNFNLLPVVLMLRDIALPYHTVRFNPAQAVRLCWQYLWAKGYRRIGCAILKHTPEIEDDRDRFGAALSLNEDYLPPKQRIPPLGSGIGGHEAFVNWIHTHRPDAVIGFRAGFWWQCLDQSGKRIPFVCLHASTSPRLQHIPGAYESSELHAQLTLRQLDALMRSSDCGIPKHKFDLVIDNVWHEGDGVPPVHSG